MFTFVLFVLAVAQTLVAIDTLLILAIFVVPASLVAMSVFSAEDRR